MFYHMKCAIRVPISLKVLNLLYQFSGTVCVLYYRKDLNPESKNNKVKQFRVKYSKSSTNEQEFRSMNLFKPEINVMRT